MVTTPIKRRRYITMPGDDRQPPGKPAAPIGQVISLGVARQRLRGVTANRGSSYHRGTAS